MHLFNLNSFAQRFGIDMTVSDFNEAVTEASHAATRSIASQFRFRDFNTYSARRDIFRCGRMHGAGSSQHRQFRLARGFIDGVTGFTAYYTDNPVHVHDMHATILHLFGLDHTRLTYRFQGRDFRLTDVYGRVLKDIIA